MLRPIRIIQNQLLAPQARLLRLERYAEFEPGMVIGLTTSPQLPKRLYSLAGGQNDPWFEVLYTKVADGLLTPRLWELAPGDELWCDEPQGRFVDSGTTTAGWIANGTGIAPFWAMVKSGLGPGRLCLQGARDETTLYGRNDLAAASGLDYIPCVTTGTTTGYSGRLTDWLRQNGPRVGATIERFMICGSAAMIVEVREILINLGITHERIASEIYF
jgi:ferredoxin--NADP+ reductase